MMTADYTGRDDAPFGDEIWSKLDDVVTGVAKGKLSGRRLLEIEGPYGLGLKHVPLEDGEVAGGEVRVLASGGLPVAMLETSFTLGARDLANFEATGFSLDSEAIAMAAIAMADQEDALVFEGSKELGIEGLLTARGALSVKLSNWDEVGAAANDIIKAVNALDAAGFHGPYKLALAPSNYNLLHRLYPQGYQVEMQHVESIVGSSVIKAPGIKKGGVLLADGKQYASIVIGQDLMTGFVGPDESGYTFKIFESLVPRIRVPSAVCVLKT